MKNEVSNLKYLLIYGRECEGKNVIHWKVRKLFKNL